jgi:hypothetical protein
MLAFAAGIAFGLAALRQATACLLLGTQEAPASSIPADDLLAKLKANDSASLNGFTVSATMSSSASTKPPTDVRLTCSDGECAIEMIRNPPAYKAKAEGVDDPDLKYAADGSLRARSEDRILLLFNDQKSTRLNTYILYHFSPEGKLLSQEDVYHHIVVYPPDSHTLVLPKLRMWWTSGRGFSGYIKKVTGVAPAEGGLVRVQAEGMSMVRLPGKWTLLVDPRLGYMVREAEFFYPNQDKPEHIIRTTGLITRGKCLYPERGSLTIFLGDDPLKYEVTFHDMKLERDEKLYSSVEAVFIGPPPPNTDIHDDRVVPGTHRYVNSAGKTSGQAEEGSKSLPQP